MKYARRSCTNVWTYRRLFRLDGAQYLALIAYSLCSQVSSVAYALC